MSEAAPAYGLWLLVFVNSAIIILIAYGLFRHGTSRDWRSFGAFSTFLVAVFTEMLERNRPILGRCARELVSAETLGARGLAKLTADLKRDGVISLSNIASKSA